MNGDQERECGQWDGNEPDARLWHRAVLRLQRPSTCGRRHKPHYVNFAKVSLKCLAMSRQASHSKAKMRFQSFFILITIQPLAFASSIRD
jgi:hypothetical protein